MNLETIIKQCVEEDELSPYEINTGNCDVFADKVLHIAERYSIKVKLIINDDFGHAWLKHQSKHYDAETPQGMTNWRDLPAIKRCS